MAYDLTILSPDDFENLIADLFSAEWGVRVESFKPGKDMGIDLRNTRVLTDKEPITIQCKRYATHRLAELYSSIKKEKTKLDNIQPKRYVLATSVALSPTNKNELVRLLSPWCKSTGDVYGASEVNGLLRDHPEVERAHFKLWVSSTAVLERILHSRIFNVTQSTVQSTKDYMSRIVMHEGFNRALEMLREEHHVLIMGNPGIGKTTLARVLLCHYMRDGFEPVCVMSNIEDAWDLVHGSTAANRKMVIFYDDFLGRFRFDSHKFAKNEEHSLLEFLNRVRRSPNLRFILTTREYILADAQRIHGAFDSHAAEILKCTLSLADYSRTHRAKMLFNHLYFSDLPDSRLERLVLDKVYQTIVSHDHFNPRIVETISKYANSRALSDDEYIRFVKQEFDNPSKIWDHPFRNDISPTAQQILAVLWTFGGTAEIEMLKASILCMHKAGDFASTMLFTEGIRQLDGNFISTNNYSCRDRKGDQVIVVQFQNPSVEEFVENFLLSEPTWLRRLTQCVVSFAQVEILVFNSAGKRGREALGKQFWLDLREVAASVEGTPAGKLINYQSFGERARRVWDDGQVTRPKETRTLLEIESNLGIRDSRFAEIQLRTTSTKGWARLMSEVFSDYEVVNDLKHLNDWVIKTSRWAAETKTLSNDALREAVISFVGDEEEVWLSSLSTLRILAEMIRRKGSPIKANEKSVFATAAKIVVEKIDENSSDWDDVFGEQDELSSLENVCGIDLNEQAKVLERVAEKLAQRPEMTEDYDPERPSPQRSEGNFDVDALFQGLLDR
jgi:hypothetical protein